MRAAFLLAIGSVPGASAKLDKWGCNPSTGYPHCACKHACIHVTQWQTPEFACCMAEPDDDGAIPPPADSACDWQAPGYADTFYDLQMFGRTGGAGYTVAPGDGYRYAFGVCEVVSVPPTPGCVAHPPSSASVSAAFQAAVSGDTSGTCYSLGQNAQKSWALTDPANPAGGVTLRYFGGTADNCPGFARSIELAFSCGDDYSLAVPAVLPVDEPAPCVYRLALKSGYACPTSCPQGVDAKTGALTGKVCSGLGSCGYDASENRTMCVCDEGFEGRDCSFAAQRDMYCGPGTFWTTDLARCATDQQAQSGCCLAGTVVPTPAPAPTPAPSQCAVSLPAGSLGSSFAGTSFDLSPLTPWFGSYFNVSSRAGFFPVTDDDVGHADFARYDFLFGLCSEVTAPDTVACRAQTALPATAAAWQLGKWGQDVWATECNSLGTLASKEWELADAADATAGIAVVYRHGTPADVCPGGRSLAIRVRCADDYENVPDEEPMEETEACKYIVEVQSAYGCPVQCLRGGNGHLCSAQGTCGYNRDEKRAQCVCDPGFAGADCSRASGAGDDGVCPGCSCGGTAAGSVFGTMAAVGLAGFVFVKRGNRLTGQSALGNGGGTRMQALRAPMSGGAKGGGGGGGGGIDLAAEYSEL